MKCSGSGKPERRTKASPLLGNLASKIPLSLYFSCQSWRCGCMNGQQAKAFHKLPNQVNQTFNTSAPLYVTSHQGRSQDFRLGGGPSSRGRKVPPTQNRKLGGFGPLFFQKGTNYPKKKNKKKKVFASPRGSVPGLKGSIPGLIMPISGMERTIQS